MNRLYRTLWYFNRTRKTFGWVQALSVTLWGLRNPWYRDNHILGNEVDRIAGAYLDRFNETVGILRLIAGTVGI